MPSIFRGPAVAILATTMVAASALLPITHFAASSAFAKGDGGGGNGKGGGDGGQGKGGDSAASGTGSGAASSVTGSINSGTHGKGASSKGASASKDLKGTKGAMASTLGALNAAHASPNALAHASPNSRVGHVAAYKEAVNGLNTANANLAAAQAAFNASPTTANAMALANAQTAQTNAQATAAQALATAANKSISASTVTGVNSLLGVSLSAPTTPDALAAQAAALQTQH